MEIPPPPSASPPPPPSITINANVTGSEIEPNPLHPNNTGEHPTPSLINRHQVPHLSIVYGRCTKNYASTAGGLVHDGCGEFMPTLNTTPTDPKFMFCDACGCHRSYHRETHHSYQPVHHAIEYQCPPHMAKSTSTPDSPSPQPISSSANPPAPRMLLTLNQGLPPQPTNNNHPSIFNPAAATGTSQNGKKRFRSKFSEEQKTRMLEFAERIGWKLQKKDEDMILGFCEGIGVTKGVFKVWMHNHKNSSVKNNHRINDGGNAIGVNGSSSSS